MRRIEIFVVVYIQVYVIINRAFISISLIFYKLTYAYPIHTQRDEINVRKAIVTHKNGV